MEWKVLTKHVYYTENDPDTDRPYIGYIRGEKASMLLDAGNSSVHAALLQKGLKQAGLPMPRYVALSHAHWDHTYGLCGWEAVSLAGEKTNEILGEMTHWKWDEDSMRRRVETGEDLEFCDLYIRKEYPDRSLIQVKQADISFRGELQIDLGGVTCLMREIGSPHAKDCVLISVPEDELLFLGDSYSSVPVGNEWVYDKKLLEQYLELLEQEEFQIAIKGHHPPQKKEELLAELKKEWEALPLV